MTRRPAELVRQQADSDWDAPLSEQTPQAQSRRTVEVAEAELQALRARVHEQEWQLRRAEAEHEKTLAAYTRFIQDVTFSSAAPTLQHYVDLSTKEILGSGHFGYVFTCRARRKAFITQGRGTQGKDFVADMSQRVVVKVQSARQADSVVREWHHGSARSQHPHMVKHLKVLIHSDEEEEIKTFLEDAFSSGALKGKPRSMPDRWFCILEEYMDGGTAQYLMDKKLLQIEGIAAILRQVADAVSCLHAAQETHNDIKPENVLLKVDSSVGVGRVKLIAKLADMGSAEYSVDRSRDLDLLAYTIWCMVMGAAFKKCPSGEGERQSALRSLREAAAAWPDVQMRQGLPDIVDQLWHGCCDLQELQALPWLRSCEVTVPDLAVGVDLKIAARKTIIANAKRKSSFQSRVSAIMALSPSNLRKLQSICSEGSCSPSSSPSVSDDEAPGDQDTPKQGIRAVEPPSECKLPGSRPSIASHLTRCVVDADQDGSVSPAARSASAGAGPRGPRRGAAARQGRPALEEPPTPPSTARRAGEGRGTVSFGVPALNARSALGLIGGGGAPGTPSSSGGVRRQDSTDSNERNAKLDNLMRRFPSRSCEEVLEALREACGHAGRAAESLRKSMED